MFDKVLCERHSLANRKERSSLVVFTKHLIAKSRVLFVECIRSTGDNVLAVLFLVNPVPASWNTFALLQSITEKFEWY